MHIPTPKNKLTTYICQWPRYCPHPLNDPKSMINFKRVAKAASQCLPRTHLMLTACHYRQHDVVYAQALWLNWWHHIPPACPKSLSNIVLLPSTPIQSADTLMHMHLLSCLNLLTANETGNLPVHLQNIRLYRQGTRSFKSVWMAYWIFCTLLKPQFCLSH
jgi:hypothetical protein